MAASPGSAHQPDNAGSAEQTSNNYFTKRTDVIMYAQTVIRLMGYPNSESCFYVNWEQDGDWSQFKTKINHPLSNYLRNDDNAFNASFIVYSTTEIQWHVKTIRWTVNDMIVTCESNTNLLKKCIFPDEWIIKNGHVS